MKALYRLPYSDSYLRMYHEGTPTILHGYEELDGKEGFVIAPFCISEDTPLLLIPARGAEIETKTLSAVLPRDGENGSCEWTRDVDESYRKDFECFHKAIEEGHFAKLVLARTSTRELPEEADTEELFLEACRRFPRAMVMLFSTPQSGTWLIASPEILIDRQESNLRTMSLAGTMPYAEGLPEWSEKNKHEQNIVERYIENIINTLSAQVIKDGPRTVRAGALLHLRTDFRFRADEDFPIGQLVARLHPTPAVSGLPKADAWKFIMQNETTTRKYYSGFAGPLNLLGETHLYVSLRCMNVEGKSLTSYAGGGIMPESNVEDEWKETEMKMLTLTT